MRTARKLLAAAAWLCAGVMATQWLALRLLGERWWVTTVHLYAPHVVLLVPIAALALPLALFGPRRMLLVLAAAAAVVLFGTMGLALAGPSRPTAGAPRLRVATYNVDTGAGSIPVMVAELRALRPDLILLQESTPLVNEAVAAAFPGFAARASTQFLILSRWPVEDLIEPPKVRLDTVDRSPRFVHTRIDTPLGRLAVFDVHPISPREGLEDLRGEGFLAGLRAGGLLDFDGRSIARDTALRRLQAEAIAALARASSDPVLIGGDTNMPVQSRILAETLGDWTDAFDAVGRGFGQTFPVGRRFAWMRIDRILAGRELRFLDVGVGAGRGSDHYLVWADLERPP